MSVPNSTFAPQDNSFNIPSYKPPTDNFTESLKSGNFKVTGDSLVSKLYDQAPDKQKYKNTLTNSEIATLNKERPDNKKFGNAPIFDAKVKASDISPTPIEGGTIDIPIEDKASIFNPYRKSGLERLTNKYIATSLIPTVDMAVEKI